MDQQHSQQPITIPSNTQSSDTIQALIPTKNMPSLISYYCGVFGLIPILGLLGSVAAIILGIIGLRKYNVTPTPGAKSHAIVGVVLGSVELVIFAAFVIFVIFIPAD